MRQVVLDTETTGLYTEQGHRIIEIGCLELVNRKLTGRHYHQYINPERMIDIDAMAVHGITNEFVKDKPTFATVCAEMMDFISGAELIIHNAPFDLGFINYELGLLKHECKAITDVCGVLDTLVLAKKIHVGQRNSLDALCKRYSIDNTKRDYHGALLDADLLAKVYLAMTGGQATMTLFDETQKETISDHLTSSFSTHSVREKLSVIKATTDEVLENEKYLKAMSAKGKCLWLLGEVNTEQA
jgi:DNA polymerase-3 subunit epsilon